MNVGDLREYLENLEDTAEVRLATQSSWPFENHLINVVRGDDLGEGDEEANPDVVWLVEGEQTRYLPQSVADAAWGHGNHH